jgi:flagellar biosynthesis protein
MTRVLAAGQVAEQIRALADAKGVAAEADTGIAELLAAVEAEGDIPVAAFAALAGIVTFLYRADGAPDGDEAAT